MLSVNPLGMNENQIRLLFLKNSCQQQQQQQKITENCWKK